MKVFFRKLMNAMNIRTDEMGNGDLLVHFDPENGIGKLMGTASPKRLTFANDPANDEATRITPGCRLLADIERLLAEKGGVRHACLPAKHPVKRKDLRQRHEIIRGAVESFSTTKEWATTIRCFVKIVMSGEEVVEEIIGIEFAPRSAPRRVDKPFPVPMDAEKTERPIIRLKIFHNKIQQAMRAAEKIAVEQAENMRAACVQQLYKSLERLRAYYRQIREEAPEQDAEGRAALENEYRRRREEEVDRAAVRIRLELLAVETVAEPVIRMRWKITGASRATDVQALYSMYEGRISAPVMCQVCGKPAIAFGLAGDGRITCPDCLNRCGICGADILKAPGEEAICCAACGRVVCIDCATACIVCGERVCRDHVSRCEEGCSICGDCARLCPDCPPGTIWCRDHTVRSSENEVVCRIHAVYCVGCREPRPESQMSSCQSCGQTVCPGCREPCQTCGAYFCLNHIEDGRCEACQITVNSDSTGAQRCLF